MKKCLVTGAAGFIGSHLSEQLVDSGCEVIGIDRLTNYYSEKIKEANIEKLKESPLFTFYQDNLLTIDLQSILQGVDFVFHQAAQPRVRSSWGKNFDVYTQNNILATQRLLEAVKGMSIRRFVFASSSSIYGDTEDLPMTEDSAPKPVSPYGVSKLAAEHLCYLYWKIFGVPVIALRYFTVFGPRQRPDMAFHKFIKAMSHSEEILIYGNGEQTRDFTFVDDVVEANIQLMGTNLESGDVFNIAGGSRVTINEVIRILERILNTKANVKYVQPQNDDVAHTYADTSKAMEHLGYKPQHKLEEGLEEEISWIRNLEAECCEKV